MFLLNLRKDLWLKIRVDLSKELVENFRDRFLTDVVNQMIDDLRFWSEDVWNKLLLLSADQQGNELAEVT